MQLPRSFWEEVTLWRSVMSCSFKQWVHIKKIITLQLRFQNDTCRVENNRVVYAAVHSIACNDFFSSPSQRDKLGEKVHHRSLIFWLIIIKIILLTKSYVVAGYMSKVSLYPSVQWYNYNNNLELCINLSSNSDTGLMPYSWQAFRWATTTSLVINTCCSPWNDLQFLMATSCSSNALSWLPLRKERIEKEVKWTIFTTNKRSVLRIAFQAVIMQSVLCFYN